MYIQLIAVNALPNGNIKAKMKKKKRIRRQASMQIDR